MADPSAAQPVEGRSAGKAPMAGRLRIGQIVSVGPHAKASIPSRFETILNTGQREKDAFGSRTHRFDDGENDLPGPGSYRKPRTLVKLTPSQSKKGTGSFASGTKIARDAPRALFISPGPGAYDRPGQAKKPEPPSAAFAPPVPRRAIAVPPASFKPTPPGPGDYNVPEPGHKNDFSRAGQSAVFGSRTKREEPAPAVPVPGPGEYTADNHLAVAQPTAGGEKGSAVFRSATTAVRSTKQELGELAKTLPPPPVAGPELFQGMNRSGSPRSPTSRATDLLRDGKAAAPPTIADEILARKRKPKPSSMFAPTVLDRFGRPTVRYVPEDVDAPGPGQYEFDQQGNRMLISSSWAMSGIERFEPAVREKWNPPGPAFYTPSMPPDRSKSSFHLNNKGVWVG